MGEQAQTENNNVRLQYSKVWKAEAAKFFSEFKIKKYWQRIINGKTPPFTHKIGMEYDINRMASIKNTIPKRDA